MFPYTYFYNESAANRGFYLNDKIFEKFKTQLTQFTKMNVKIAIDNLKESLDSRAPDTAIDTNAVNKGFD